MAIYCVTGKPGAGKSLYAISEVERYIRRGLPVAVNYDLYLEHWPRLRADPRNLYRLPAKPTADDLETLPCGNDSYDESKNGLLVLDECGTFFNSRSWNDAQRKGTINWLLHSRKKGWDVLLLVQDIQLLDKQGRDALCEYTAWLKRFDRMRIPIISTLCSIVSLGTYTPKFPIRLHYANIKYGDTKQHPTVDRRFYRGTALSYRLYDTKAVFVEDGSGTACFLSPWLLAGRHNPPMSFLGKVKELLGLAPAKRPARTPPRSGGVLAGQRKPRRTGDEVKIDPHHNPWIYGPPDAIAA